MYIVASVAIVGLIVLCGYVIYLWQKDKGKESKRLYAWLDDMLDRIGSENIERYALCRRIKYEMGVQSINVGEAITKKADETPPAKPFVHNKR